jgi:DNA repair protein RecN (Recombination protein N)
MLAELTITNFAIIERVHIRFASGFNVLTGETGAGKSILIDAVSFLLGGRADTSIVRTETELCTIEGIFFLSPQERASIDSLLEPDALQNEDPNLLILAREIRRSGHNVCRINGRAVRLGDMEAIGEHLIDIHGQSEHLSLLQERTHLDFLDRYASLGPARAAYAQEVHALRAVRRELDDLLRNERELNQRVDLLRYQIDEIAAAHLEPGEEETLTQERNRLANAERLTELSGEVVALLADEGGDQSTAIDLLGQAVRVLASLARVDPATESYRQRMEQIEYELNDVIGSLRDYQGEIEFNPARLNRVEERISLIRRLQHKYGDSIEEVLGFEKGAAEELDRIEHSEERIVELRKQEQAHLHEIGQRGSALSALRRVAAAHLSEAVEAELAELRMEGARFEVQIRWREAADGAVVQAPPEGAEVPAGRYDFDEKGLDQVAFLLSANVGEELKPMVKVASGGETSRLMLALKTALARADQIPTLIFDEIDQGIGGRVGGVVGRKLWELSQAHSEQRRQVFCVTHLPQLAGYADSHLHVRKTVAEGRTRTVVDLLDQAERIRELAQMLGGESEGTREIAEALLAQRP